MKRRLQDLMDLILSDLISSYLILGAQLMTLDDELCELRQVTELFAL